MLLEQVPVSQALSDQMQIQVQQQEVCSRECLEWDRVGPTDQLQERAHPPQVLLLWFPQRLKLPEKVQQVQVQIVLGARLVSSHPLNWTWHYLLVAAAFFFSCEMNSTSFKRPNSTRILGWLEVLYCPSNSLNTLSPCSRNRVEEEALCCK